MAYAIICSMTSPGKATWAWHRNQLGWIFPGEDNAAEYVDKFYLPLGQNMQRLICRFTWAFEVTKFDVSPTNGVAPGDVLQRLSIGTDGGLEDVLYLGRGQIIPSVINDQQTSGDRTIYYSGYTLPLDLDFTIRRTNGVDRDSQIWVQLLQDVVFYPITQAYFPNGQGAGQLDYLGSTPGLKATA
jgi:hypothetical protein